MSDPLKNRSPSWDDLVADAVFEAQRAMRKFPQPNYVITKFAEQSGEVVKAAVNDLLVRAGIDAISVSADAAERVAEVASSGVPLVILIPDQARAASRAHSSLFRAFRARVSPGRKDGARRMRGVKEDLFTLRNLRVNVFG